MARIFLSHSSLDGEFAGEVHRWLVDDGHEAFFDRESILVGDDWEQRLHEQLRWADAVVCIVTTAYVNSVWCAAELGIARSRGSRVMPVRTEPGVSHPLLGSLQYIDCTTDAAAARTNLKTALRIVDLSGGSGWSDDRAPFPGLRPFESDYQRMFFGRGEEITQLAQMLRSPAERVDAGLLLVVGPSGCGKSSLVRAGLLPIMANEPGWWSLSPMKPGGDPIGALTSEFAAAARLLNLDWAFGDVRGRLEAGGTTELVDGLLSAAPPPRRRHLLLVVDQFEELLTQSPAPQRLLFANVLRSMLTNGSVQLVATLRPEYLGGLLRSPELTGLETRTTTLRPLRPGALRLVIEGPAQRAGIQIDEDLVAQLVDDTGSGAALPLLAYTLAELATGVGRGGELLMSRYLQIGGVQGTLARQADLALGEAIRTGRRSRDQVMGSLMRLVNVDDDGRPNRWRVKRAQLEPVVLGDLDKFVAKSLLITDSDPAGGTVVEFAHEAILSAWQPLKEAISANTSALRARRLVEQAAAEWQADGRPPGGLWEQGRTLSALTDLDAKFRREETSQVAVASTRQATGGKRWHALKRRRVLSSSRVELGASALDFLRASIHRNRRRRRRSVTTLSTLLVIAVAAASIAVVQLRNANERQRIATARLLVTQANDIAGTDLRTALRLDEAAVTIYPDPETQSGLTQLLSNHSTYGATIDAHQSGVNSIAYSPDGRTLASLSQFEAVYLWDVSNPAAPRRFSALRIDVVESVSFSPSTLAISPDGRTLVVGSYFGNLAFFDIEDPTQPRMLSDVDSGQKEVRSVAFSPDGQALATGGANRTAELWDVVDPARPRAVAPVLIDDITPAAAEPTVFSPVAFSPDGHILATGSTDIILWDITDESEPHRLGQVATDVDPSGSNTVAFSPDGRTMAIGGPNTLLWDVTNPTNPRLLSQIPTAKSTNVLSLAFSPDGQQLATGGTDNTAVLWDLSEPTKPAQEEPTLTGHTDSITTLAFAPSGRQLATGSDDTTIVLWDLTNPARPGPKTPQLAGHTKPVTAIAVSPDGRTLATAGQDDTVILWDLDGPDSPLRLGEPLKVTSVLALAFSPDGRLLASGSADNTVVLWDISDRSQPHRIGQPLKDHDRLVVAVDFSPDGHLLAVGSADKSASLWDVTTPDHPRPLSKFVNGSLDWVWALAFSPDGRTLATSSDRYSVALWDITTPTNPIEIGTPLAGHTAGVHAVSFSPDGHTLALGSTDHTVTMWDVKDVGKPIALGQPFAGGNAPVNSVAFAKDGQTLATAARDGVVDLWDVTNLAEPRRLGQPLIEPPGDISVEFIHDGNSLLVGGGDNTTSLWDLSGLNVMRGQVKQHACGLTNGGLDTDQWARYIPDLVYQDTCADGT